jgi:hypothetical protein
VLRDYLKNLGGWRTREKLIVFNVDDYGSVRLSSPTSKRMLLQKGLSLATRFDCFDALETGDDLDALFTLLSRFRDSTGRHPPVTAYTMVANPDFEFLKVNSKEYRFEILPKTFERLSAEQPIAYNNVWSLWQEGVANGLLRPQLHGREHFNVQLILKHLAIRSPEFLHLLEASSMISLENIRALPNLNLMQSFSLEDESILDSHVEILSDAVRLFSEIFGYPSRTFTPPGQTIHPKLFPICMQFGIDGIDKPCFTRRHLGNGKFAHERNHLGLSWDKTYFSIVRNVVFEPGDIPPDQAISRALQMIQAAFWMRKPAIISSHRVNFAGHLDPQNRRRGLLALSSLFSEILSRWPEAVFISADELLQRMEAEL